MNKLVKIIFLVIGVLLIIGGLIYAKLFVIGNKSYENIVINQVVMSGENVSISGEITDSSRAYKTANFTQVGPDLYVTINSVLVSKKYSTGSFQINIPINWTDINVIHLSDGKTDKVIYSK